MGSADPTRFHAQFHNYPRYRLTVVWSVSAELVISPEIIPAKLSRSESSPRAPFYDCCELISDLISHPSINFESEDLGSITDTDDWRISCNAIASATVKISKSISRNKKSRYKINTFFYLKLVYFQICRERYFDLKDIMQNLLCTNKKRKEKKNKRIKNKRKINFSFIIFHDK